jgi:DNA-binding transcriptional MerR regulator
MKRNRLSSAEAARYLGIRPQTLRLYRHKGLGPPYARLGGLRGRAVYCADDLEEWLLARTFTSTSQESVESADEQRRSEGIRDAETADCKSTPEGDHDND